MWIRRHFRFVRTSSHMTGTLPMEGNPHSLQKRLSLSEHISSVVTLVEPHFPFFGTVAMWTVSSVAAFFRTYDLIFFILIF